MGIGKEGKESGDIKVVEKGTGGGGGFLEYGAWMWKCGGGFSYQGLSGSRLAWLNRAVPGQRSAAQSSRQKAITETPMIDYCTTVPLYDRSNKILL